MGKTVELIVNYGIEHIADGYIEKAREIANWDRIEVTKSYSNRTFTGTALISFANEQSADTFRRAAMEISKTNGGLYMLDGVRFTEFDDATASGHQPQGLPSQAFISTGQPKSIHEKNLEFWTPELERESTPRPGRARVAGPALASATPQIFPAQIDFSSRAVSTPEYSQAPFNAVGKLKFTGVDWTTCSGTSPYVGSAWLIAPRIIMTVAHNFFETNCVNSAPNVRSQNIVFVPGRGGPDEESYSVIDFQNVPKFEMDPQFGVPNPAAVNDVAVGILDRPVDSKFGFIPVVTDGSLQPNLIRMLGYPVNKDAGLKMWMCEGAYLPHESNSFEFSMSCDFKGGASGGPWVVDTQTGWKAIGLQSGERAGNICFSGRLGQQARDLIAWAESVVGS